MRYYKTLTDGYISAIGTGLGGTEITESEYNEIKSVINNMPQAEDGYWFRLTNGLTWENYEIVSVPPAPEPTTEERIAALEKTTDDMILLMAELIGGN